MKITEQRLKKIIKEEIGTKKRHLLVIPTLSEEIYKSKTKIDEGIWDSIKFGLAKLGSLEASGKLFGKDKVKKAAQDKLDAALEKESSNAVKALIDAIKSEEDTKDFPNMKDQWAFQSALASILVYYDSLKAAIEKYQPGKEEQPEGAMSPEAANAIVETLHQYLVNTLDNSLSDVYKHFKENLEEEGRTLAEMLDEVDWAKEAGKIEDEEPEEQFYDKKSTTMAGLESNFLPVALSILGGTAYSIGQAIGTMASLEYTREFITDPGKITEIPGRTEQYFDAMADSEGLGFANTFKDAARNGLRAAGENPGIIGNDQEAFVPAIDYLTKRTGREAGDLISGVMKDLGGDKFKGVSGELGTLTYQYAKEGAGKVGDVINQTAISPKFIEWASENGMSDQLASVVGGAGMGAGAPSVAKQVGGTILGMMNGGGVSKIAAKVAETAAKQVIKSGAVTAGAKAAALVPGLGAILGPMGLTVAGGGLAIKVLRMKGKASSRASDLQTARDYIKKFAVEQPVLDPSPAPTPPPEGGEEKPTGEKPTGEKPPEGSEEGPTPEEEEAAEEEDIFLALGKLDDDGLKIHRSNARNPEKRSSDQDTFQKAQDQAVTGRRSDPNSDDLGRKFGRGLRGPEPETLSHSQMQKKIKGRSKKPGDAFLTVDASIYNDIAKAIRKAGGEGFKATAPNKRDPMKKIVQGMLNQLVSKDKKITAAQAKQRIATAFRKKAGLSDIGKDQMDPIVAVLQDYGLVRPGGTTAKPTKKKQTPKKQAGRKATPKKKAAPKKPAGKEKEGELNVGADGIEFGKTKSSKGTKVRPPTDAGTMRKRKKTRGGRALEEEILAEVFKRWSSIAGVKK